MKSSDQRYHQVQRKKRDTTEYEKLNKALVLALRDARTGLGSFDAVEAAVRAGAAEWSHVLLATGRTATEFHRNFRRGSPTEHRVTLNSLVDVELLRTVKLDGFTLIRLSSEQTKNVKLRWTKLHERDVLLHDPQGALWSEILGCMLDGARDEHLAFLERLRDKGLKVVEAYKARGEEEELARIDKLLVRDMRSLVNGFTGSTEGDNEADFVFSTFLMLKALALHRGEGREPGESEPEARLRLEKHLIAAEDFLATGTIGKAVWSGDTSGRHCSSERLRKRVEAAEREYRERGLFERYRQVEDRQERELAEARNHDPDPIPF